MPKLDLKNSQCLVNLLELIETKSRQRLQDWRLKQDPRLYHSKPRHDRNLKKVILETRRVETRLEVSKLHFLLLQALIRYIIIRINAINNEIL